MDELKKEIEKIVFNIIQDIKIYKIDRENSILEVDYDMYVNKILQIFKSHT